MKINKLGPSVCYCFSCGISGSIETVFTLAHELLGGFELALEFIRANDKGGLGQALGALAHARVGGGDNRRRAPTDIDRYAANCSRLVPTYLTERRGVIRSDVERWKIGFDPELCPEAWNGKAGAAVFPCWDEQKKLVGCSRRTVWDGVEPKFYDTPGVWKSEVFYGEHDLDLTIEEGVLVEGVLGTIFARRVLPNSLGVLGVAGNDLGDVRLTKLRRWFRKLTLLYDNDPVGRNVVDGKLDPKGRWIPGLRQVLRREFVVKVGRLPTEWAGRKTKDPADYGDDTAEVLLRAVRNAEYLR